MFQVFVYWDSSSDIVGLVFMMLFNMNLQDLRSFTFNQKIDIFTGIEASYVAVHS